MKGSQINWLWSYYHLTEESYHPSNLWCHLHKLIKKILFVSIIGCHQCNYDRGPCDIWSWSVEGWYMKQIISGPIWSPVAPRTWRKLGMKKICQNIVKYDSNQFKAAQISTSVFNLFNRMQLSTISNTALKSSNNEMAQFPESTNSNRSFTLLIKADSVLCLALNPHWKGSSN